MLYLCVVGWLPTANAWDLALALAYNHSESLGPGHHQGCGHAIA